MGVQWNKIGVQKKDRIFLMILIAAGVFLLLCFIFGKKEAGNQVEITIDGELYACYSLEEEASIPIYKDGKKVNELLISGGKATMVEADCKDQICVEHKPISNAGETIVCLPNKIVVTIVGKQNSQMDVVVP